MILLPLTTFDDMLNTVERRSGLCRKLKLMYHKDSKFTPDNREGKKITAYSYFRYKEIEFTLIFHMKILKKL